MRKICVVIASRANYGRLLSVLRAVDEHPGLQLQLIVAASAVGLPIEYKPDAIIQCQMADDNLQAMTLTTGLFLCQLGGVLDRLKPDIVVIHGDRHEVLAAAIAASYMNIPILHTEGGDISSTIDGKVRHAITQLSDIHCPVTELSASRLIKMGADPGRVYVVGSTALDSLAGIDLTNNRKEKYILVLFHPDTTNQEDMGPLISAVMSLPFHVVWVNSNTDAGAKEIMRKVHGLDVEFLKNLPPEEYARLLNNCELAIGNSSSFIKEACFLGVPAILAGTRQNGREVGKNVTLVDMDYENIRKAVKCVLQKERPEPDYHFGNGTAGKQIADILARE